MRAGSRPASHFSRRNASANLSGVARQLHGLAAAAAPAARRRAQGALPRAALIVWLMGASSAAAEEAPAEPVDRSAELFRRGRELLAQGQVAEACQMFDESLELRRSAGTLLNIGSCRARAGDLLAALAAYRAALELARAEPDARKAQLWSVAAEREIGGIEPRLASVELSVLDPAAEVRIDAGTRVARPGIIELNPGAHRVRATAPGKTELVMDLKLAEGEHLAVTIPVLTTAPAASATGGAPPALPRDELQPAASGFEWHWPLLIGGGVLFAGGAAVAAVAIHKADDLAEECPDRTCPGDLSSQESAKHYALTADLLMGAGLVTAGIGALMWAFEGDDEEHREGGGELPHTARVGGACDRQGCGLTLTGRF